MRAVSFGYRLRLDFAGNLNTGALALGDVDHDGDSELVVGNIHGDLAIFKHAHRSMRPWRIHRDLGTITAVAVGDIRNHGRASVVVVTAEGFCYVFDFTNTDLVDDDAAATSSAEGATTGDTTLPSLDDLTSPMGEMPPPLALHAPSLRLPVPVNISRILIADVDRDGQMELLVARTDRVLHAYRLEFTPLSAGVSPVPSSGSPGLMRNSSSVSLPQQARLQSLTVAQQPYAVQRNTRPAASMRQAAPTSGVTHMSATVTANAPRRNMTEPLSVNTSDSASGIVQTPFGVTTIPEESATNATSPKLASVATGLPAPDTVSARGSPGVPERATLVELRMWQFQQQLGSMAAGVDQDGEPCLFIAQPGGRFLTIHSDGRVKVPSSKETSSSSNGDSTHGAGQHSIADITTELEVLNQSSTLALCTMDGTIKILPLKSGGGGGIDNSSYDMPANAVWELNVDRELFSMAKVTGMLDSDPDVECVAACAWDGTTYIVDGRTCDVVEFRFPERVCAFAAGTYALLPGANIPCLVYATFHDEIFVYYNISMRSIRPTTLLEHLAKERDMVNNLPSAKDIARILYGSPAN